MPFKLKKKPMKVKACDNWRALAVKLPTEKTPKEKKTRVNLFNRFDGGNGELSLQEVRQGFLKIWGKTDSDFDPILVKGFKVASDHDDGGDMGQIEVKEFRLLLAYLKKAAKEKVDWREYAQRLPTSSSDDNEKKLRSNMFKKFDVHGKSKLALDDIRDGFKRIWPQNIDEDFQSVLSEAFVVAAVRVENEGKCVELKRFRILLEYIKKMSYEFQDWRMEAQGLPTDAKNAADKKERSALFRKYCGKDNKMSFAQCKTMFYALWPGADFDDLLPMLKKAFKEADTDKDGFLELKDFRALLLALQQLASAPVGKPTKPKPTGKPTSTFGYGDRNFSLMTMKSNTRFTYYAASPERVRTSRERTNKKS